jgi:RNA methyltransferase, TrmH family
MSTTLITSHSNPKVKQARVLRQRKQRAETGLFLVEGLFHIGEALAAQAAIDSIFYAPDLIESDFARQLIDRALAAGIACYATTAEVFASLAEKENPQGVIAVVRQQRMQLADLTPQTFPWGVAIVSPQDPGNVGTILRTIDAVGASGLILLDSSVDPYHPTAVRASLGSIFWCPIVSTSFAKWSQWAKEQGYHIYGTSSKGSVDYKEVSTYEQPLIVLLGSEREGLSREQAAVCDQLIRLPMRGHASSLNLAVAAGVVLYAVLEKLKQDASLDDNPAAGNGGLSSA